MHCSGCGFEVESGFAFCPRCGMRQPAQCPDCGFPCAPAFAFCPKCGTRIAPQTASERVERQPPRTTAARPQDAPAAEPPRHLSAEADRRTVTILFADLSGFTGLAEELDPEDVQALQNALFKEWTAAVESFGGFVDKYVGDALLALFGAPLAHEDDPERALRAALDMIARTARLEAGSICSGRELQVHIGINTGPVVTGGVGVGTAKTYSVTGDTVNTAQRLQALAGPGEVFVGPLTHRLTRHAFSYLSLGNMALRGKAGSVLVHRLGEALAAPRAARGLEALGLGTPLVGRDPELQRMLASLEESCGGAPQLVSLVGEAGIGKSRLLAEFIGRVGCEERFREVAIRQAACSPLGERSYGTIGAVVRAAAGMAQGTQAAQMREGLAPLLDELGLPPEEAGRLTPLLYHVLGLGDPDGTLKHVEPEQLRRQILHAVRTMIERRLALSPLLILIEDLHWADAVSLEALRFVMDRLEHGRLMLVVTHRPGVMADRLSPGRVSQTTLRLPPLARSDAGTLLAALLGEGFAGSSPRLHRQILERSGGNPLFMEEMVRGLLDLGALKREGQEWRVVGDETVTGIPDTIQAMLLARIDRLPQVARRLAQEAAVIGPRFDEILLALVTADPARLDEGLELLCDTEIIQEVADTGSIGSRSYRFTKSLLQDVIYQNLLLQRRTEMHGHVAIALERLCGEEPERLEDLIMLGHHFALSAEREKGARYLGRAGGRARMVHANDDALRFYEQALSVIDRAGESPLWLQISEAVADLCGAAGRRAVANEHYGSVLLAFRRIGDRVGAARILRKLGRLLWDVGKRDQANARYLEAAGLLEGAEAPIEQAQLWQERGRLAFRSGDNAQAAKWADEALERVGSPAGGQSPEAAREAALATAEALNTKGVALARLGRQVEAIAEVERSIRVAEAAMLPGAACRGYTNLGVLYTTIDPARALEVCQRGLDLSRRIGDLGFQARLLTNLAVACCTFTDRCPIEGVPAAEKAIELDRALDQREHLPVPLIVLGQIHQCRGETTLAARFFEEALELARETGEPQLLFPCYDGLATLNLDVDNLAEAERLFSLAQDVCAQHGLDPDALVVLPFLD